MIFLVTYLHPYLPHGLKILGFTSAFPGWVDGTTQLYLVESWDVLHYSHLKKLSDTQGDSGLNLKGALSSYITWIWCMMHLIYFQRKKYWKKNYAFMYTWTTVLLLIWLKGALSTNTKDLPDLMPNYQKLMIEHLGSLLHFLHLPSPKHYEGKQFK